MNRLLFAMLASAVLLGGCELLDPSADASSVPAAEREYITGSHLPARNHNISGTKVYELDAIDRDEMLRPKSSSMPQ